jgi:hypothetical protein
MLPSPDHDHVPLYDPYSQFLAERRYHQAITRPWLVVVAAGVTVVLLFLHAVFSSLLVVSSSSFVNPYFGGIAIATTVAIYGLATTSTKRWPPAVVIVALGPSVLRILDGFAEGRRHFRHTGDKLFMAAFATMLIVAIYLLVRSPPTPPSS